MDVRPEASPKFEKIETPIPGCFIIRSKQFMDFRGSFEECMNVSDFRQLDLPTNWPQTNMSWSKEGIIRGLHVQTRHPQGKLVRCLFGEILDVCLDVRIGSPTFGKHFSILLNSIEPCALYLPAGAAHGFSVQKGPALVHYHCTSLYEPDSDSGVLWNDPEANIDWRLKNFELSSKDKRLPTLQELKKKLSEEKSWH